MIPLDLISIENFYQNLFNNILNKLNLFSKILIGKNLLFVYCIKIIFLKKALSLQFNIFDKFDFKILIKL